jgi:excisionase family DNA binding protein
MEHIQKAAFTIDEAAAFLNLSKNYVYKLVHLKKIPHYKPLAGRVFFKPSELEAFLFRNRQGADYEAVSHV